jgi:flagellar hook protein FlgE
MLSSLYSGISGLLSNSEWLDTISNNVSNVNTVGYKAQNAQFEDVLYQTIVGANGTSQVGSGSALESVNTDFSQGSFESTNSSTDLAIGGQGFYIVKKSGDQTDYYTRAGSFSLDTNGDLIDASGDYVQGKAIDQATGTAFGVDGNIVISQQPSEPKPTATMDMVVNLDSSSAWAGSYSVASYTGSASDVASVSAASNEYPAAGTYTLTLGTTVTVGSTVEYNATLTLPTGEALTLTLPSNDNVADVQGADATTGNTVDTGLNLTLGALSTGDATVFNVTGFNPSSPSSTSNYSSSMTVYDSLGTGHVVTVYFAKTAYDPTSQASTWNWYAVPQSGDAVVSGGSGTLMFNANGVLTSGGNAQPITFDFAGAQAGQTVNLVMGSGSGEGSTTQYSSSSNTVYQSQDGYPPGVLQSISVSQAGVISGSYDNGQILKLYQLDLANFNDPQGLERDGGNLYSATLTSGVAYTSAPGQGGMGKINANSLEESNVDLATEFSDMIIAQSGYEANSKVITTTDEILQTLMNMKTT